MMRALRELYALLTPEQRRRLLALQLLVIGMSVMEVVSVMSIGPFMAMVGNLQQIHGDGLLARAYRATGIASPTQFVLLTGAFSLVALTVSTLLSMYTLWRLSMYGTMVGAELGVRLFSHYMRQPWLFHAQTNTSQLTSRIVGEVQRVTYNIINAFMHLNAKVLMTAAMAAAVIAVNPIVAVVGLALFGGAYLGLYSFVRSKLALNGRRISESQARRFKLMAEGFGGIKDTLLLGRQGIFTRRFAEASREYSLANGSSQVIAQIPRHAVELLAFGSVILLVIYLTVAHGGDMGVVLPLLSIYALAGLKLLPAFQQVYSSATQIRAALPALDSIKEDLRCSLHEAARAGTQQDAAPSGSLVPRREVRLQAVGFRFPGAARPALREVDLTIPAMKVVGIVGSSGAGKSTAIDLLLGLIQPTEGQLLVDGVPVGPDNLRAWQNGVGFVAQSIFLADASIRENIAFGLPPEDIDDAKVEQVARMARLDELLATLPRGLDTTVGERGVQLSGGQRQRIGIARALYGDAQVLVLDEATSALDGITERLIMDAIHDFGGQKTVVMVAHRLATVRKCDWIYMLDAGRVVDEGDYDTLISKNATFRVMAEHA